MRPRLMSAAVAAGVSVALSAAAHANTLTAQGVTYSLSGTTISSSMSSTTEEFTLDITGINGPLDTVKAGTDDGGNVGRYGVQSFALSEPTGLSSSTVVAPTNFTVSFGGLNSSGCNSSNDKMVCFTNNTTPIGPALASNSELKFVFDLTVASGSFTTWTPTFKINWDGTKNNYNLVSKELDASFLGGGNQVGSTPLPSALPLFASGLAAMGLFGWRRKRKAAAA